MTEKLLRMNFPKIEASPRAADLPEVCVFRRFFQSMPQTVFLKVIYHCTCPQCQSSNLAASEPQMLIRSHEINELVWVLQSKKAELQQNHLSEARLSSTSFCTIWKQVCLSCSVWHWFAANLLRDCLNSTLPLNDCHPNWHHRCGSTNHCNRVFSSPCSLQYWSHEKFSCNHEWAFQKLKHKWQTRAETASSNAIVTWCFHHDQCLVPYDSTFLRKQKSEQLEMFKTKLP